MFYCPKINDVMCSMTAYPACAKCEHMRWKDDKMDGCQYPDRKILEKKYNDSQSGIEGNPGGVKNPKEKKVQRAINAKNKPRNTGRVRK